MQGEPGWTTRRGTLTAIDRRSVFEQEGDLSIESQVMPFLVDQPRKTKG